MWHRRAIQGMLVNFIIIIIIIIIITQMPQRF